MYTTVVTRQMMILLTEELGFAPGDVVDVSRTRTGSLIISPCDDLRSTVIGVERRGEWMLEDLMERISVEGTEEMRLFGAHYLRYLRKLTARGPSRAAYAITL